ncbi:hypothetical protein QTI24_25635 [Variovorax sp. J22P240]|uniref:hypothetical protein n=1 Tax=Variovorax sp. J22P240 TaxID=3053514 RepID=UPI0025790223|nr:hypothetical protein [Variovorax sp. J22P240]MDM0002012.1 hypothetical protein [Variovorax sp. J22P240]
MSSSLPARWLAALPALAACAAVAQTPSTPASTGAGATPPALTYRSALDGYRPFADDKPIPWREANDTVHGRGGWRAYAKEAQGSGDVAAPSNDAHPQEGHGHAMSAHKEHP